MDKDTNKYFGIMFQLDRLRIFGVEYVKKTIFQGKIGKEKSSFTPIREVGEFSTWADLLQRGKRDIKSGGQAQEMILANFPIAKNFYEKWDNKHLMELTDEEYNEMIKDLNVLKDHYNYIEEFVNESDPTIFNWQKEVELSKMKPKNKIGESVQLNEGLEQKEYLLPGSEITILYNNIDDIYSLADIIINEIASYVGTLTFDDIVNELKSSGNRNISEGEDKFNRSYLIVGDDNEYYIEILDEQDALLLLDELYELWEDNVDDIDDLLTAIRDEGFEVIGSNEDEFDEGYEKLEEDSTENYWDAKEIKRDEFMALMKFNFGTDSKGNNYIITVDANDVNRFYADTDEEAVEKYNKFKEEWNNSEHGDLTQDIKLIAPRTENKEILTERTLNKEDMINGFEEYTRKLGLEPEEADIAILGEYITDELLDSVVSDTDLDLINDVEEALIEKYNLQEPDYDDTEVFYESENSEKSDIDSFSGIEFEWDIPYRMRFKQWDVVNEDPYVVDPVEKDLYWVTQQFFGKEEVEQFAEAFKKTKFEKAFVTVRDLSTYVLSTDMAKNVLVIIDKNGNIDSSGYEAKIKEVGYDFDYETGKWDDTEVIS